MKIIPQSAILLASTPGAERLIETAGRVCYRSGEAKNPSKFIRMLLERGHESVLEHASATLMLVTDRAIANELERHRLCSFSQESTRYIRFDDLEVVKPEFGATESESESDWRWQMELVAEAYSEQMLRYGEKPEIARAVLPLCLATRLVMTANLREWRHILKLRLAPAAHPQMQELARLMLEELRGVAPTCFEEFKP